MGKDRVINSQSFHDGKVVLYQLENRPKQLWLCRIKVPNGSGYLYRGTGTSDLCIHVHPKSLRGLWRGEVHVLADRVREFRTSLQLPKSLLSA